MDRSKAIRDLNLPKWDGRSMSQQIKFLKENYSQSELKRMYDRALSVLDTFDHNEPEWDVLADLMDPHWHALPPEYKR